MLLIKDTVSNSYAGISRPFSFPYNEDGSSAYGSPEALGWVQRANIASQHGTSLEDLAFLANDCHYCVRVAVAKSLRSSQKILDKLTVDSNRCVRAAVAANPNISLTLLMSLENDGDEWVRQTAIENLTFARNETAMKAVGIAA